MKPAGPGNEASPPASLLRELERACTDAAAAGGAVLRRHYGRLLRINEKSDGTGLVTNADLGSENAILRKLKKARPDFGVLAEESGKAAGRGGEPEGRWIIDPLDGTNNFVHGFPMFCVSIAAEWRGTLVAGVIYHPVLDEMYVGIRGKGARMNGRRIRVSNRGRIEDALLTTGFTYQKHKWLKVEMRAFEHLSSLARAVRRPGSAALDLAYTARGVFDGFWERRLAPWDVAAGAVLVREAGGTVSAFDSGPFDPEGREILAANRLLHPQLSRVLSRRDCQAPSAV
ncbi:MAG: inositol monophosphatase [Bdellovibrionales bacterium]|nr:inositol monophosphatase [Bdellovibrionales bacterium]